MNRVVRWVGAKIEHPIDVAELLRYLSEVLLVVTVLIALVTMRSDKNDTERRADSDVAALRAELDARDEESSCRSFLAAEVSKATSNYLLTIGDLVVAIPGGDRAVLAAALKDIDEAGDVLEAARDARDAFEKDPAPCPADERPPTARTA